MARNALWLYMYDQLANQTTITTALGGVSATNRRIYASHPQEQPKLSTNAEPDEGWMAFTIDDDTTRTQESIYERVTVRCDIYTTLASLAEPVLDELDRLFNWKIWQQRDVTIDGQFLLFSLRERTLATYEEATKLYHRTVWLSWTLVQVTAEAG